MREYEKRLHEEVEQLEAQKQEKILAYWEKRKEVSESWQSPNQEVAPETPDVAPPMPPDDTVMVVDTTAEPDSPALEIEAPQGPATSPVGFAPGPLVPMKKAKPKKMQAAAAAGAATPTVPPMRTEGPENAKECKNADNKRDDARTTGRGPQNVLDT